MTYGSLPLAQLDVRIDGRAAQVPYSVGATAASSRKRRWQHMSGPGHPLDDEPESGIEGERVKPKDSTRQRLRDDAREPAYIKTVRSEGYVFAVQVEIKASRG